MADRPVGRQTHVTGGGKGVHRRGEGLNTGPVGLSGGTGSSSSGAGSQTNAGRGSSPGRPSYGQRGSGGGGLKGIIIFLVVLLLGGGGGLTALLSGGSGSGSNGTGGSSSTSSGSSSNASGLSQEGSAILEALLGNSASSEYGGYSAPDLGSHSASGYGSSGSGYSHYGTGSYGTGGYGSGSYGSGSSALGSMLESLLGSGSGYGQDYGSLYDSYGSSGSGSAGTYDSGSSYDAGSLSGGDAGLDLSSLSSLFETTVSSSAAGISSGWNDGQDNRGKLDETVAAGSREKFTRLKGNGRDTVTIMVYMCGTDLEANAGMATSDLKEMASASIADNVNVLVYTGGCTRWRNDVVSSSVNQIYQVGGGGLRRLVDNDGNRAMTDPATLSRFIKWCAKNYPANRNELIFWDHGSGSLSGYGYDQKHSREGSMDLSEIRDAVRSGGVKFDFIGFDACLMATVENALALSDYADYLIASEETEPGTGWYYTNWLSDLSADTGMATTLLGREIIDDFIDMSNRQVRGQSTTLSLVDLAELANTFPEKFSAFSDSASDLIRNKEFKTVSTARNSAREFAVTAKVDQVDLTDMAWKIGNEESMELVRALLGAIKYNRTSSSMCNSYGLSIYFPGSRLSKVDAMVDTYEKLGMDDSFAKCICQYATMQTSGQSAAGGTSSVYDMLSGSGNYGSGGYSSPFGSYSGSGMGTDLLSQMIGSLLSGRSIPENIEGLDAANTRYIKKSGLTEEEILETISSNTLEDSSLQWSIDGEGRHILSLSQEQWDQVSQLTVNMLFDDGEGYVDLGLDNVFSFTLGGDLIGETNRTWISIEGQPVAYYTLGTVMEGETAVSMGLVPALLNGERVNLIIVFDNQNPFGYIAGARRDYIDGETQTQAKAITALKDGDKIDFMCDHYDYDGKYLNSYFLGSQLTVNGAPMISNTDVGEGIALVSYRLTDLYGQQYWTLAIEE